VSGGEHQRFRFGPLERRGLIGSLRAPQVITLAAGLAAAVVVLRAFSGAAGVIAALLLALGVAAFCFWPISGRSAEEWLPIVTLHLAQRARGRHIFLSPTPQSGVSPGTDGRPVAVTGLPEATRDLMLLAAPYQGDQAGVIKDRGTKTYTAALAVKVTSFGLLDRGDQESRQAGWGGVLSSLAREGSPVSRIQWIERTVPADGDEIGRYLGEAWERELVPLESLSMQSYLDLTSAAPAITTDHELVVCLQIDAKLAWRQIKREGGKRGIDAGACALLLRELEALSERLTASDIQVVGALRPGMVASSLRVAFDPWWRPSLARLTAADPEREGVDEAAAWPTATETAWGTYHTENAYHATYWISSWPRIEVGVAFLSPLLLHAQMVRAVAVTIEPVSPAKAVREVEAARTTDIADRDLRGRMGFIETARGRRRTEAVARREEELADGHAALRFAGYVTVSARSLDGLERHCSEIEHAGQMARLELLRLYGQQPEAFTYTLPLCRGLR
jgi:hypothetical protein